GEIKDGVMYLSDLGIIARTCWQDIPQHFQYTSLDSFIIMPDHMHGIVTIDKPNDVVGMCKMDNGGGNHCRVVACNDPTITKPSENTVDAHMSSISPKSGSLPTIIRSYKSAVTKRARQIDPNFTWQPRYYDHIIRNAESAYNIRRYIQNNVQNWVED
ncbi:MAG: transposase, partial [Candidatus Marinimicrobia bacterium]|nr:transposase [Candidatus Neomarinimicrobiota bacterium]